MDPNFAMAHAALAAAYDTVSKPTLAAASATKAYELRTRLTEPARFNAEDLYFALATGEQEKRSAVLSQWVQSFPDDFIAHYNLAQCLQVLGQPDRSLAEAREAVRLFPSPASYGEVILGAILTDRIDEAKAAYAEAEARKFDSADLRDYRAQLASLQRDIPAMEEQWNWAVGKPGADSRGRGRGTRPHLPYGRGTGNQRPVCQLPNSTASPSRECPVARQPVGRRSR